MTGFALFPLTLSHLIHFYTHSRMNGREFIKGKNIKKITCLSTIASIWFFCNNSSFKSIQCSNWLTFNCFIWLWLRSIRVAVFGKLLGISIKFLLEQLTILDSLHSHTSGHVGALVSLSGPVSKISKTNFKFSWLTEFNVVGTNANSKLTDQLPLWRQRLAEL